MSQSLKIAIIGDYNFTYNSHHATNLAIDHSAQFLDIDVNYYWIKLSEVIGFRPQQFQQYDGFWVAPGPITNPFFLHGILKELISKDIPTLVTGEAYKTLLEVLMSTYQLNARNEKLISDNLVDGEQFEKLIITPHSDAFKKLYSSYSNIELTATRFSIYPQVLQQLIDQIIDIEAHNQFEDPEIISLKHRDYFLACGFCPQISSTREIPHPIIYTFMKSCLLKLENLSA